MTQGEQRSKWKGAYEEHGPAVFAFLQSRVGDRQDAEDLLQDTFVRAIRATEPLRDVTKTRSYLFTIAHNVMVNHVRKKREVILTGNGVEDDNPLEQVQDVHAVDPGRAAEASELEDRLNDVMAEMSEAHRTAFDLGVLQQKPYREIARVTGWTPAQVKINIYRARKQAVASLAEEWTDE